MDTTNGQKGGEMLGVSRSGRIRKKSSKLMDFQNPDEIDTKPKKRKNTHQSSIATDESESESPSDEDSDDIEEGIEPGEGDEDEISLDPTVRKSLYMQEKSNKKRVLKDGKIVFGKTTRKDKGKSRLTAYMLWSRENRSSIKHNEDYVNQSRRLAEMWANVPTQEKIIWRRKAKRITNKNKKQEAKLKQHQVIGNSIVGSNESSLNKSSSYLNRSVYVPTGNPVGRPPKRSQPNQIMTNLQTNEMIKKELNEKELQDTLEETALSIFQTSPIKNAPQIQPGVYKVTGLEPLDVAAHLNLLGESLSIIGERLKEHEGQITVSGSLSVLLDSLLCSLGPLMCLTCAIPSVGTDSDKKLRDNMHKTLDNIAYIMPGL